MNDGRIRVAALVTLCAVGYLPFIGGGLLTDDFIHFARLQTAPTLVHMLATPDPFHFYRPVVQSSFWLNSQVSGMNPELFRATNLLLHLGVIACVFALATRLLVHQRAALLATLAFALTPKAHPIAVLWISARGDLLMALFSLFAVLAWLQWLESRRARWVIVSSGCYLLAVLSKETAILLPLLLLVTPSYRAALSARRIGALLVMIAGAAVLVGVRVYVGAIMPGTPDSHYGLLRPAARWARNLENYLGRVGPSALGMLGIAGVPAWLHQRGSPATWDRTNLARLVVFAVAWFAVFVLPILPIPARSELYLYLPGVGFCLLAGFVVDRLFDARPSRWLATVSLGVYIIAFGVYQISRSHALHDDLRFSEELVRTLRVTLKDYEGPVWIVPADTVTHQYLADSVGGYADVVLKSAAQRYEVNGMIDYHNQEPPPGALRLSCAYRNGSVVLTRS